jgi:hypothetical protein
LTYQEGVLCDRGVDTLLDNESRVHDPRDAEGALILIGHEDAGRGGIELAGGDEEIGDLGSSQEARGCLCGRRKEGVRRAGLEMWRLCTLCHSNRKWPLEP